MLDAAATKESPVAYVTNYTTNCGVIAFPLKHSGVLLQQFVASDVLNVCMDTSTMQSVQCLAPTISLYLYKGSNYASIFVMAADASVPRPCSCTHTSGHGLPNICIISHDLVIVTVDL